MSTKERILSAIQRFEDDITIDQAIDQLYLLKKVEIGLKEADQGLGIEHDSFMKELMTG